MNPLFLFLFLLIPLQESGIAQTKNYKIQTVAFYNLENLFDCEDDPMIFDEVRTQNSYHRKLSNMAKVISEIGDDITGTPPVLIGVCEVENQDVLQALLNQRPLKDEGYGMVHFDSPDLRGIDVALLYRKGIFVPIHTKAIKLILYSEQAPHKRLHTRDQLVVSGKLDGESIHLIVNHWPSRRGGEMQSRYRRLKAATLTRQIIDSLWSEDPYAKIITMGDLNDDPTSPSVKEVLEAKPDREALKLKELFNPMEDMYKKGLGTLAWRDGWNLFDQMIISSELLKKDYSSYRFYRAGIYNKPYLTSLRGRYKGYPYRSFSDGTFTGGYSDHFPVYLYLIKEIEK